MKTIDVNKLFEEYKSEKNTIDIFKNELNTINENMLSSSSWTQRGRELKDKKAILLNAIFTVNAGLENKILSYYHALIVFPGDEKRFEEVIGYAVKPIDIETPIKLISLLKSTDDVSASLGSILRKPEIITSPYFLLEKKIIGMIEAKYSHVSPGWGMYSGLPIVLADNSTK